MRPNIWFIVISSAVILVPSRVASGHEFRPCLLELRDLGAGRYAYSWTAQAPAAGGGAPEPVFPAHCHRLETPGGPHRSSLDCAPTGLSGSTISIAGLAQAQVDAVVRYSASDGAVTTRVLRADAPAFTVPGGESAPQSKLALASTYLRAGVDHILRGWDHLLFILGLLLLVKRLGPLVRTITAFTLAHSLTLALAVTGAVRVPQAPAEALIALSLMLLAAELARPAERAPLARRRPWAMAFTFGLLHGFGFAGALAELGLPQGEIPLALFAFNAGVECGQLAFIFAALAIAYVSRQITRASARRTGPPRAPPEPQASPAATWKSRAPAYAIGALAAFWLLERIARLGS